MDENKIKDFLKGKWKFIILLVVLILSIILSLIIVRSVSSFTFELKEARVSFEKGIEQLGNDLKDRGEVESIHLKADAFSVIDDTEILIDDGISNTETESMLNRYKLGDLAVVDGDLIDSKKNGCSFNGLYNIDSFLSDKIENIFNIDFMKRLKCFWKQYQFQLNVKYYQQRDTPKVGNIICVPTSARILLSGLGYEIPIKDLLDFFAHDEELHTLVRGRFGSWIEKYIKNGKLYQITGAFAEGLNLYMGRYYPDFPYILTYDYLGVDQIADYVENYGLMSSTYFPHYVIHGKRSGGHMITITKTYRDFNGTLIGFGIHDPFGNPNAQYIGSIGYDGESVVVDIDTMLTVMKSYYDDHGRGSKSLYRVLYFKDK